MATFPKTRMGGDRVGRSLLSSDVLGETESAPQEPGPDKAFKHVPNFRQ